MRSDARPQDRPATEPPGGPSAPDAGPPDRFRRAGRIAGVLYLVTFVSMPTLALFERVDGGDFVLGAGAEGGALIGAFSEVVVALAGIGTAVVLYPVARRQNETAALGFVTSRVVEGSLIIVGVVSVLTMITLRRDGLPAADPAATGAVGLALGAAYDWTFLLSQSLMPVFNAVCLGTVLYRSGLVPRMLPVVGLIGAPLLLMSDIAIFFGVYDRMAPVAALAALPIAAWELSLGVYLTIRGFRPVVLAALVAR